MHETIAEWMVRLVVSSWNFWPRSRPSGVKSNVVTNVPQPRMLIKES